MLDVFGIHSGLIADYPASSIDPMKATIFRLSTQLVKIRQAFASLGTRTKLKTRSPRKKCWFCHIIAKYHVPDLWECESGRFSSTKGLQNNA